MLRYVGLGLYSFGRAIPTILRDLIGLAGAVAIAYGAWLLHPAAGYIVGGSLALAGAILASLNTRN